MAQGTPSVRSLLLDTNIALHLTRDGSAIGKAIDAQFGLSTSSFRPAICEVTVGELLALRKNGLVDAILIDAKTGLRLP